MVKIIRIVSLEESGSEKTWQGYRKKSSKEQKEQKSILNNSINANIRNFLSFIL